MYGLKGSVLALPLISQHVLDSIARNAPKRRDNVLFGEFGRWFWPGW